jgi:hypothetical protein
MRLISPESGQTLHLVRLEELKPANGTVFPPDLINGIVARYGFTEKPRDIPDAIQNGYKFAIGRIYLQEKHIFISKLDIYGDGVICICSDTISADMVIDDLIVWSRTAFKLSNPLTGMRRSYTSSVVVEFDRPMDSLVNGFARITAAISEAYGAQGGYAGGLYLWRMSFMADPQLGASANPTQFILERRAGAPADRQRYFSSAPLPTDKHLQLLQRIESMI